MNQNNGYIYIRIHEYYNNDNVCKLGKSKNISNRDCCYATGECEFILVIEKLLQNFFKKNKNERN